MINNTEDMPFVGFLDLYNIYFIFYIIITLSKSQFIDCAMRQVTIHETVKSVMYLYKKHTAPRGTFTKPVNPYVHTVACITLK